MRDSEKQNMHYLLSPSMCDYVSARFLLIHDNLNRSAFSLIAQFLEKAIKQIIILSYEEDVKKHFKDENGDIFSYLKSKKLLHHNTKQILEDHSQIIDLKEIMDKKEFFNFISSFSDIKGDGKWFTDTRYGKYYIGATYPTIIDTLDELAFKLINTIIAKLSNHPIKVHVPENMKKYFLFNNKYFSESTIEEIP
ncbi:hypothetical protein ACFL2V_12695 [Pseudomonadota bacterium]